MSIFSFFLKDCLRSKKISKQCLYELFLFTKLAKTLQKSNVFFLKTCQSKLVAKCRSSARYVNNHNELGSTLTFHNAWFTIKITMPEKHATYRSLTSVNDGKFQSKFFVKLEPCINILLRVKCIEAYLILHSRLN